MREKTIQSVALAGSTRPRMAWLDGLRGIAALAVVFHHLGLLNLIPGGPTLGRHFDLGIFGVFLFFVISGWIIPASLERRGDVRRFWVGRIFRIYPLILVVVAFTWLLPSGYSPIAHQLPSDRSWQLVANTTLLHDFLGARGAISVLWTLGFEMIFYYFATALFMAGRHRSGAIPLGFAAVGVVAGASTASSWFTTEFSSWFTRHLLTVATVVGTALGLALLMSAHRRLRLNGSVLLAAMSLALLVGNARAPLFECCTIFSTMFAGSVCLRLNDGQLSRRSGSLIVASVIISGAIAGLLYNRPPRSGQTWTHTPEAFVLPFLAAWAVFGLGRALADREWPRPMAWLGRISYSSYLIHVPLMWFTFWFKDTYLDWPNGWGGDTALFIVQVVLVLFVSQCSYRWVELPWQRLGRRISNHLTPINDGCQR